MTAAKKPKANSRTACAPGAGDPSPAGPALAGGGDCAGVSDGASAWRVAVGAGRALPLPACHLSTIHFRMRYTKPTVASDSTKTGLRAICVPPRGIVFAHETASTPLGLPAPHIPSAPAALSVTHPWLRASGDLDQPEAID
jgi:hypothetical protein